MPRGTSMIVEQLQGLPFTLKEVKLKANLRCSRQVFQGGDERNSERGEDLCSNLVEILLIPRVFSYRRQS